jgi:hypothetical protein
MKKVSMLLCAGVLMSALCAAVTACNDEPQNPGQQQEGSRGEEGRVFYYYGIEDRKIFLDQVTDKVYVKFAPTATKEQFLSVVTGNASLRPMDANAGEYFIEGYPFNAVVLEGKERISLEVINSFKARDEIVSATYLLEYNGVDLSAYTDEFIVKLKGGTTYAQLQELADKNNSRIGKEDEFVKNQYMLYVSKTSELDAMQTANLFYETGLFEFAEPNIVEL